MDIFGHVTFYLFSHTVSIFGLSVPAFRPWVMWNVPKGRGCVNLKSLLCWVSEPLITYLNNKHYYFRKKGWVFSWMMLVVVMWMYFFLGDLGFLRNFGSFCCRLRCVDNSGRTSVLSAGSWRCVCVWLVVNFRSSCSSLLSSSSVCASSWCRNISQVIFHDELVKRCF